jgi:hypothetical protein
MVSDLQDNAQKTHTSSISLKQAAICDTSLSSVKYRIPSGHESMVLSKVHPKVTHF